MIYPISARTSTDAWLQAVNLLNTMKGRCAYNIILDIEDPIDLPPADKSVARSTKSV